MSIKDTYIQPMYLQITKSIYISSKTNKYEEHLTEITSKWSAYETCLDKLRTANINNIDTAMKEYEETLNKKFDKNIDDIKAVASISINPTFFPPNSHNSNSSSNQHSADITKWTLLKSPYFHSHALKFTKYISPISLEGDTLPQLKQWWDDI